MKWLYKPEIDLHQVPLSLTIQTADGQDAISFPGEVIDQVRYMMTQLEKKKTQLPVAISVISALRGEGVTWLSHALAATIAHDVRERVCLIDLNWWWPWSSPLIDSQNLGLAGYLTGEVKLEEVVERTAMPNLFVIPAGVIPRQDRPVFARSQSLKDTIAELNRHFDYLILDVPAILSTNDAIPLAGLGTFCCLVVRQGATSFEDIALALDEVSHLKVRGVIMNQVRISTPHNLLKLISA